MAQCFYLIGALNYYAKKKDTGSNSEKIDKKKKRFYVQFARYPGANVSLRQLFLVDAQSYDVYG